MQSALQDSEVLFAGQKEILELIIRELPLEETLDGLVRIIERRTPGMLGSILLLDDDGEHVRHGAAPSLPEAYISAIDGEPIGPRAGSCGTAAYRKKPVLVEDIATDPLWEGYRDAALGFGLRACWSTPILDADGEVLGTFAMYYREPGLPDEQQMRLIDVATHAAAIAITRARSAESQRRERQQVLERIADGVVALDRDWRYVYLNRQAARMLGREKPEDLIGRHIWAEYPEGIDQPFARKYREAIETQKPIYFEDFYAPWNRWFENRIHPSPEGLTIFFTDVTERKQAELEARESVQRLREAVRAGNVGLWDWDLRTDEVYFSPEWKSQIGYEDHEISNDFSEWERRVHPEDLEQAAATIRSFIEKPWPDYANEFRFRHKDGSYRWILAQGSLVHDDDGKPVHMLGSHIDITDRKRAEDALRQSEHQLRLFVEHSPATIAMFDRDMRYVVASRRWYSDYGLVDEDIIGRSHYEVFPDLPERWKEIHRRALAGEVERCDEDSFPRGGGRTDWVRWEVRPWREPDGEIGGIIIFSEVITEAAEAGNRLRESEEKYRSLAENLRHVIYRADPETFAVTYVNPAVEQLYGWSSEEWMRDASLWSRTIHPEDRDRALEELASSKRAGDVRVVEYRILHRDGAIRHVEDHVSWVLDENGAIVSLDGIMYDVTDRKLAEEQKKEVFLRNEALIRSLGQIVYDWHPPTGELTWAGHYTGILGYSAEEMGNTTESWTSRVHPDDLERVFAEVNEATRESREYDAEYRFRHRDGSYRWMRDRGVLSIDDRGELLRIIGVFIDITPGKRAEEALRASERRLRTVLDGLGPSMFVGLLSPDGILLEANQPALQVAGLAREDVIGRRFPDAYWWSYSPEVQARLWKAIEDARAGEAVRYDETVRAIGDQKIVIDFAIHPLTDEEGLVTFLVTSAVEITQRKSMEDLLRQTGDRLQFLSRRLLEIQETERRQLARELHDELGQALTAAKISLQTLQRYPDPAAIESRLEQSIGVVDRALGQVRSMSLELRPPLLDDLGLGAALRWLADQRGRSAGLHVEIRGGSAERFDEGIEVACFRVAQEALTNVARHAGASRVVIEVMRRDHTLHLHVSDDGTGFDVGSARRRAEHGESFGLLNMEERTALTGGGIEWRSTPGEGTEVHAWFPL